MIRVAERKEWQAVATGSNGGSNGESNGGTQWRFSWIVLGQVVLAFLVGGGIFGTLVGLIVDDAHNTKGGTVVPEDPDAVVIEQYPDRECPFPEKGVAGAIEAVGVPGTALFVSNCHRIYLLHTIGVDADNATVQSTPVPSNLATVARDHHAISPISPKLKFATYHAKGNTLYVSFLRSGLPGGCVSVLVAACAFDGAFADLAPEQAPHAECWALYDAQPADYACGSMNMHATGLQLLATEAHLFLTTGDLLQEPSRAQDDASFWGKLWRAPLDKAPLERSDWILISKGHRNAQGLCPGDAARAQPEFLVSTEHGGAGGDEINVIPLSNVGALPVPNYGWPQKSYGDHYDGRIIPDTHAPEFIEPVAFWPYNLVGSHGVGECLSMPGFYVVASLNGHKLYTLVLDANRNVSHLHAEDMGARLRSLAPLDDCHVLILTEPTNGKQGPLLRKNICGRGRFHGDPRHVHADADADADADAGA